MKYNGKEVTEEFAEKVQNKLNNLGGEFFGIADVKRMFQAAEEVFAEMEPAPVQLQRGDTVTHNLHPKWGKGEVRKLSKSGKTADVYFSGAGWCSPLTKNLTKIEEAQHGEG
jgi:hypothetical protein